MSRIYLIITLCLFTFLACTNSENSNDPEKKLEQDATADKSIDLENAVGYYETTSTSKYHWSSEKHRGTNLVDRGCTVSSIRIFELAQDAFGLSIDHSSNRCHLYDFTINGDFTWKLTKIEGRKWLTNKDGWYIVIPKNGFSEDLSSIVLAYEDSLRVQAYPFDKVK